MKPNMVVLLLICLFINCQGYPPRDYPFSSMRPPFGYQMNYGYSYRPNSIGSFNRPTNGAPFSRPNYPRPYLSTDFNRGYRVYGASDAGPPRPLHYDRPPHPPPYRPSYLRPKVIQESLSNSYDGASLSDSNPNVHYTDPNEFGGRDEPFGDHGSDIELSTVSNEPEPGYIGQASSEVSTEQSESPADVPEPNSSYQQSYEDFRPTDNKA